MSLVTSSATSALPRPAGEGRGEGEDAPIIPVLARPRRSSFSPSPHSSPAGRGGRTHGVRTRYGFVADEVTSLISFPPIDQRLTSSATAQTDNADETPTPRQKQAKV